MGTHLQPSREPTGNFALSGEVADEDSGVEREVSVYAEDSLQNINDVTSHFFKGV